MNEGECCRRGSAAKGETITSELDCSLMAMKQTRVLMHDGSMAPQHAAPARYLRTLFLFRRNINKIGDVGGARAHSVVVHLCKEQDQS